MICMECATECEAFGDGPFVIFICPNCGQVIDPEKTFDREKEEEFWT